MSTTRVRDGAETLCDFPGCGASHFQETFGPMPPGWTTADPPSPRDFPLDYWPDHQIEDAA